MAFTGGEDRTWRVRLVLDVPFIVGRAAAIGRASRQLDALRGQVAGDGSRLTVVVTVDAPDGIAAVAIAADEVCGALAHCGAPGATVIDHGAEEYIELVGLDALIAQL